VFILRETYCMNPAPPSGAENHRFRQIRDCGIVLRSDRVMRGGNEHVRSPITTYTTGKPL
jgi:hypothetical protein